MNFNRVVMIRSSADLRFRALNQNPRKPRCLTKSTIVIDVTSLTVPIQEYEETWSAKRQR